MIELNGHKFAKTNSEFIDSLFEQGGTCYGFYKQYKNRIVLQDQHHKPFAALVRNHEGNHFVSCTDHYGPLRYSFALTSQDEKLFSLDSMGYMARCEYIDQLANELFN